MGRAIIFKPHEIPLGALVHVCAPGTDHPQTDKDGTPLPSLYCGVGGRPLRYMLYTFEQRRKYEQVPSFDLDKCDGDICFMSEAFTATTAPVRQEYAVYVRGERLRYVEYPEYYVRVAKATDQRIVSVEGRAYKLNLIKFVLPDGAILVSTGDFDQDKDFDLIGCIGIPQPSEGDRAALEAMGVVFYDHMPYKPCDFFDCKGALLPPRWQVKKVDGSFFSGGPDVFLIEDNEGRPVARVKLTRPRGHVGLPLIGTLTLA